ncbi:MAG: nickel-dependent lactate racemase [Euryarchaeota archaeon]|nr:nickel-dependent lactate racemase [Euryarchaeota archaeon]
MRLDLHYGNDRQCVSVDATCTVLSPPDAKSCDGVGALAAALSKPLGKGRLEDFLNGAKDLVVIVNDAARSTPTSQVIEALYPSISKVAELKFIVACGTHEPPGEQGLSTIFGERLEKFRGMVCFHDSKSDKSLQRMGKTSRGTEVAFNRLVAEARKVLSIGGIEPHYFAGYSGGRKAFLPGTSAYHTVEQNHRHAISPDSLPLRLGGNPVHEDMAEAAQMLDQDRIFSVQTVKAPSGGIHSAACGDLVSSFHALTDKADGLYCCPIKEKVDIVVACATHPKDRTLYQAQHVLENGKLALKDGGTIIWVAKCVDGIGSDSFMRLLREYKDCGALLQAMERHYKLGYHKAVRIRQLQEMAEVVVVSDLPPKTLESAGLKHSPGIQKAIDGAIARRREGIGEPTVIVMPQGELTIPKLRGCK